MRDAEQLLSSEEEQTRRAELRVGELIRGRWRLDVLLGMGGMAAVYAATHRNGKRVAIKMLHGELSSNVSIRQRFIDEGYVANRVGHPGAVSVIDDDIAEDGSVFLVMDLLEGETLEGRLRRYGRLRPSEVLLLTIGLLDVLAAAHDKGIVHRDIKPDNIFITREGDVKLLDFGIARLIQPGRARTTQSGATMGTPAFMAPEQARGRWEQLDGRTDLWGVGATMFVQLTGRQVHEADTVNEELLCAMTNPAPSLAKVLPGSHEALVDLVDRALSFEQEDRWANARAMQAAAQAVYLLLEPEEARRSRPVFERTSLTDSASPVTLMTPHAIVSRTFDTLAAAASPARRRTWVLAGAGGALALAIIIGQVIARHDPAPSPVKTTITASQVPTSAEPAVIVSPPLPPPAQPEVAAPADVGESAAAENKSRVEKYRQGKMSPRIVESKAAASNSPKAGGSPGGPTTGPTNLAPPPPVPVPSVDPLDRRR
ncbi:MAG TPA: serine/threonine-protein kinase [Polyangiaceae bacterium]